MSAFVALTSVILFLSLACSQSFQALPSNGVIQVSWTANVESMVNQSGGGYRVYYWREDTGSASQASYVDVPYVSGPTAPTTTTLENLVPGRYSVKVAAFGTLSTGEFVLGQSTSALSLEITESDTGNSASQAARSRVIVREKTKKILAPTFSNVKTPNKVSQLLKGEHHKGQILVRFGKSLSANERNALVKKLGGQRAKPLPHFGETEEEGYFLIILKKEIAVEAALQIALKEAMITHAQPVAIFRKLAVPNDTLFSRQWAFRNQGQTVVSPGSSDASSTNNPGSSGADANLVSAWDVETDCSTIKVAVLDTGIRATHTDLSDNLLAGFTVDSTGTITAGAVTYDDHGTQVASIIGAKGNNSTGMTGVCWTAQILPIRVFDDDGATTEATMAAAVNRAVTEGAKIINLSLGGQVQYQAFSDALEAAANSGVIIITAAGNSGANNNQIGMYPCNYALDNLLCVAALDQNDSLASYSNYGSTKVHLAAPGSNMVGAALGTRASQAVSLASGWTMLPILSWGYSTDSSVGGEPVITNPAIWNGTSILYDHNADNRIYQAFDFTSIDDITMYFAVRYAIDASDGLYLATAEGSVDPFDGVIDTDPLNGTSASSYIPIGIALRDCARKTCSVGFKFKSDATTRLTGLAIAGMSFETLSFNDTSYDMASGTSFAAPLVSGVAALVWAANPNYTAAQVITAIKESGRTVSALANSVITGKAIDAGAAVRFLEAPSGLTLQ